MAVYTFYCCRADGTATAFEAHDLRSDKAAREKAALVLADHAGADRVVAWLDDREVFGVTRTGEAPVAATPGPAALEDVRGRLRSRIADTMAVIATQDDGAILFWNRGARRLYGWSEAEAIGRNVIELTPAVQSREAAAEIMQALADGQSWAGEILLRKRDGAPFRAFVSDLRLATGGEGGDIVIGVSAPAEQQAAVTAYAETLKRELGAG